MKKFKKLMKKMFSSNENFTFENFDKYIKDQRTNEIGIYVIKKKTNAVLEIVDDLNVPEGPVSYMNKPLGKFKNKLDTKEVFADIISNNVDDEFLYIGVASGKDTINKRLTLYRNFGKAIGKNTKIRHSGGKRIWFIKNNKNILLIDYITESEIKRNFRQIWNKASQLNKNNKSIVENIEAGLIYLHKSDYSTAKKPYPFANEQKEIKKSEADWVEFWESYKF
ncbi:MAG: hypothetical protein MJ250_06680 [Alphaproteobacteria bacterium]|nr:hypothetical protein [Alphaproteobacteria bacterium]